MYKLEKFNKKKPMPSTAVKAGHQNDHNGDYWLGVAHTRNGDIPGKAKGDACWYSYNGKEDDTKEFSWVLVDQWALIRNAGGPPSHSLKVGHQKDGEGDFYSAVAHSQWGNIPGKAKGNTCMFPYGGTEHSTSDFSWVVGSHSLEHVRDTGGNAPPAGVKSGHQNDHNGDQWTAIAHTKTGDIPGKAKGPVCYYSWGGKEVETRDFSYLTMAAWSLERNQGFVPANAVRCGAAKDAGDLYATVAHTSDGLIPGRGKEGHCWYAYGGTEHATNDFSWVVYPLRH